MAKTIFIIADSGLELVPKEIIYSDSIKNSAKKRGKKSFEILLDSSYHYKEMRKIVDNKKRGRPDIIHICLLSLLGMPFIRKKPDNYRILIHTYSNVLIEVNPKTRIPRNYIRFVGLIEQLFDKKVIKHQDEILMRILNNSLEKEISDIPKEHRFLLTSKGIQVNVQKEFQDYLHYDLVLIIGGFPHGDFSNEIQNLTMNKIAIADISLDAWIVTTLVAISRNGFY